MTASQTNLAPLTLQKWVELVEPITRPGAAVRGSFTVLAVEEDGSDIRAMQSAFKERKLWALITDITDGNDSQYLVRYGEALPTYFRGSIVEGYVFANKAIACPEELFPVVPVDCGLNDALFSCIAPDGHVSFVRETCADSALAYFELELDLPADDIQLDVAKASLCSMMQSGKMSEFFTQRQIIEH